MCNDDCARYVQNNGLDRTQRVGAESCAGCNYGRDVTSAVNPLNRAPVFHLQLSKGNYFFFFVCDMQKMGLHSNNDIRIEE